jgi:hypothetical protein
MADANLGMLLSDTCLLIEPEAFLKSIAVTLLNKLHVS